MKSFLFQLEFIDAAKTILVQVTLNGLYDILLGLHTHTQQGKIYA